MLHQHDHLGLGHHEDDNHPENHDDNSDETGEDPIEPENDVKVDTIDKIDAGDGGGFMGIGSLVVN